MHYCLFPGLPGPPGGFLESLKGTHTFSQNGFDDVVWLIGQFAGAFILMRVPPKAGAGSIWVIRVCGVGARPTKVAWQRMRDSP